jgi:hypothetical protein
MAVFVRELMPDADWDRSLTFPSLTFPAPFPPDDELPPVSFGEPPGPVGKGPLPLPTELPPPVLSPPTPDVGSDPGGEVG